jgi:hypothetical protein
MVLASHCPGFAPCRGPCSRPQIFACLTGCTRRSAAGAAAALWPSATQRSASCPQVLKHNGALLPPAALFIIHSYHSFYELHQHGAYQQLLDEQDRQLLPWLVGRCCRGGWLCAALSAAVWKCTSWLGWACRTDSVCTGRRADTCCCGGGPVAAEQQPMMDSAAPGSARQRQAPLLAAWSPPWARAPRAHACAARCHLRRAAHAGGRAPARRCPPATMQLTWRHCVAPRPAAGAAGAADGGDAGGDAAQALLHGPHQQVRPLPPPPRCPAPLRCLALWLWLVQLRPAVGLRCWLRTYSGSALFGRPVDHAPPWLLLH